MQTNRLINYDKVVIIHTVWNHRLKEQIKRVNFSSMEPNILMSLFILMCCTYYSWHFIIFYFNKNIWALLHTAYYNQKR